MKSCLKLLVASFLVSLLFSGGAWAFPIVQDNEVQMFADGDYYKMVLLSDNTEYNTFCVEKYEYFNDGGYYTVDTVGLVATGGGNNDDEDAVEGFDPISGEAIWLYASYFDGLFNDISGDLALLVQNAIWYAEDEIVNSSAYDTLIAYTDGNFEVTGWDIQVVNLVDDNGNAQSQLTGVRVPEPATVLLLGTGLIGLAGLSRRKFKG